MSQKYNPESPRLAFKSDAKPNFQLGENVSVRLGNKWMSHYVEREYKPFEAVALDKDGDPVKAVIVKRVMYIPLNLLSAAALKKQPVGVPTTIDGLIEHLERVYERKVQRDELVSVLFFE